MSVPIELYRIIQFHNVLTNTIYKLFANYGRQVYYVKIGEKILMCNSVQQCTESALFSDPDFP